MVEPTSVVKPTPARPVAKPADTSRSNTPTAGAEIKTGSARVNTGGAAIPFGGLAQGGGGAGGVQLDVKNFCCPEYLTQMVQKIRSNWNANQGAGGQPIIKFTIRRDGMLTNVELEKSSGQALLDLEARRAVSRRCSCRRCRAVPGQLADGPPHIRLPALMTYLLARSVAVTLACGVAIALSAQQPPATPPPSAAKRREPGDSQRGDPGLPPKLAVPAFIALTNDAETQAAAKIVGEVLWDDLKFEREFYLIPRDTYRTIPQPASLDQVPLDRWKELGADGLLVGSVAKTPKRRHWCRCG